MPQKLIGNFINIVTKKYFCFNGRAGRAEFWLFFLAVFIVNTILGFVPKIGGILGLVWALGMLLPTLGVTARRLHDRNKSRQSHPSDWNFDSPDHVHSGRRQRTEPFR